MDILQKLLQMDKVLAEMETRVKGAISSMGRFDVVATTENMQFLHQEASTYDDAVKFAKILMKTPDVYRVRVIDLTRSTTSPVMTWVKQSGKWIKQ